MNLKKVVSIAPEEGGRGRIKLTNGENVIVSRAYLKTVSEMIKNLAK